MWRKADRDLFVSFFFIAFFVITITLFYILPGKWRTAFLYLVSCIFCAYMDVRSFIVLLLTTIYCYAAGKYLGKRRKGNVFWILISLCVIAIAVFKFTGYISARLGLSLPESILTKLIMPVGLSFYMFQVISYLVDVYQKKISAEHNFCKLGLWLSYFPKLVSGPIERENDFIPQLENIKRVTFWNTGRISVSLSYVLWGAFLKTVMADRMMMMVNPIFESPESYDSLFLICGAVLYTFQIYCDFAGYSYMAVGISEFFGIHLTMNFKEPYMSSSMTEFWRKWHISLSTWLKDYLYIPLGGNRKGIFRKIINNMFVFLVCGMWHGAGLNYLMWGFIHGAYTGFEAFVCWYQKKKTVAFLRPIGVFFLSAFAWIFFRAGSGRAAVGYVIRMLSFQLESEKWNIMFTNVFKNGIEFWLILCGLVVVMISDWISTRRGLRFPALLQWNSSGVRYAFFVIMILLIFVFGMYGAGYNSGHFIYMQF